MQTSRDLRHVMPVRPRVVGHHPPPAVALPELADDGRLHRAVWRQVHVGERATLLDHHRLALREELLRQLSPQVDRRLHAVVATRRRVLVEPVVAHPVAGAKHQMLRAGDPEIKAEWELAQTFLASLSEGKIPEYDREDPAVRKIADSFQLLSTMPAFVCANTDEETFKTFGKDDFILVPCPAAKIIAVALIYSSLLKAIIIYILV